MCKEYGLPANKTNAAMASSLTTFLGDPKTNVLARAPAPQFLNPVVSKNSSRAKAPPKIEMQETSLAALILAARPPDLDSQGKIVKKGRDARDGRNLKGDLSAFIVTAPAKTDADCMLPNTTPLLRRRRNPEVMLPPTVAEETISSSEVKKQSTREPQLVLDLNAAALESCKEDPTGSNTLYQQDIADSSPGIQVEDVRQITSNELKPVASTSSRDQGYQTKKCCRDYVQPALSHVFRITTDVDKLINRTTAMLEKFKKWKDDLPQEHGTSILVGS